MTIVNKFTGFLKSPDTRSIGIYTFTNFFAKGVSFLLLFVFTNPLYISPGENGLLSLFSTSMLFLMPFLSMGIIQSTGADFFKMPKTEFRDFFTTGFAMSITVMILAMTGLFLFREQLQQQYGFPVMFCWLIPLITFLTFCNEQFLGLVRNNQQPNVYFKANMYKIFLELGLSFVLVVFCAWRWQGRVAGILAAYSVVGVYGYWYLRKMGYLFGRIKKEYIRNELVYAVPIIAMQISIFCMGSSDRFFLSGFTNDNNETVGVYSIAATFASIIIVLSSALIQYIFPKIYKQLSSKQPDYMAIKKLFRLYAGIMLAGALAVMVFTPLAYRYFINEKYHPALSYVFILCAGYFIWTMVYFFYSFLLYFKEKRRILLLSVCCIVVSIGFNYFLTALWGARGAAMANVCTYSTALIFTLLFTRKYWRQFFKSTDPVIQD